MDTTKLVIIGVIVAVVAFIVVGLLIARRQSIRQGAELEAQRAAMEKRLADAGTRKAAETSGRRTTGGGRPSRSSGSTSRSDDDVLTNPAHPASPLNPTSVWGGTFGAGSPDVHDRPDSGAGSGHHGSSDSGSSGGGGGFDSGSSGSSGGGGGSDGGGGSY